MVDSSSSVRFAVTELEGISCTDRAQSIFELAVLRPGIDPYKEDICKIAQKISKKLGENTRWLKSVLEGELIAPGLGADQYAKLIYDRAERLGDDAKRWAYALKLTAGTFYRFHCRHEQKVLASDEVANIDLGCRTQLRRWEGRSCILSTTVTALLPKMGWRAFRVYEAAISKSGSLTLC